MYVESIYVYLHEFNRPVESHIIKIAIPNKNDQGLKLHQM